jgi:hypothetical protein
LQEEKYLISRNIIDFVLNNHHIKIEERDERIFIINLAQTYKWNGEQKKAEEIINNYDWSACSLDFQIGISLIFDDFNKAYKIMQKISINNDLIEKKDYREWPIFNKINKEEEFQKIFKEIFNESYNIIDEDESYYDDFIESKIKIIYKNNRNDE